MKSNFGIPSAATLKPKGRPKGSKNKLNKLKPVAPQRVFNLEKSDFKAQDFSADEICRIISVVSKEKRIKRFELGNFCLVMDDLPESISPPKVFEPGPDIKEELRRTQLLIDDPSGYEAQMIDSMSDGT